MVTMACLSEHHAVRGLNGQCLESPVRGTSRDDVTAARDEAQRVISAFASVAKRLLDHDRLSIYLLSADGGALERFAVATSPIIPGEGESFPLGDTGTACVLQKNQPILITNHADDMHVGGKADRTITEGGFHSSICVPLRVNDRPFGLLYFVSRHAGFYSEPDVLIAQQIADQASVFLQNLRDQRESRLVVESEELEREHGRLARVMQNRVGEAIRRIASELDAMEDDGDVTLRLAERIAVVRTLASAALAELGRSVRDVVPVELEHQTLDEAIAAALADVELRNGVITGLSGSLDDVEMPPHLQSACLCIFKEALANAVRHSRANRILVRLRTSNGLHLLVEDNGMGFLPDREVGSHGRSGFATMRERARLVGGELMVTSTVGVGTSVAFALPLLRAANRPGAADPRATQAFIRILLVDSHPLFRAGLKDVLTNENRFRVVGEACDGHQALAAAHRLQPDVILLNVGFPDCSEPDIITALRQESADSAIVIVSAFTEPDHVADLLDCGANAYVSGAEGGDSIIEAIRCVVQGGTVVNGAQWRVNSKQTEILTSREIQIITRMAAGYTNVEIGRQLYIAPKTVERSVSTIILKLEARNRTHAVALAIGKRLVDARQL